MPLLAGPQTSPARGPSVDAMQPPLQADSAAIQTVKQRLAKAESERETWRESKMQEKHLEACSMVDALNLQLDLERTVQRLDAESAARLKRAT